MDGDSINIADANGKVTSREPKGYIRRPQDQRVNVGIFFQDHLPNNPSVRGYVNLVFGSGLPFSPPNLPDLRGTTSLVSSYKRVDLGFSKVISLMPGPKNHLYDLESLWLSLEVLNRVGGEQRSRLQLLAGRERSHLRRAELPFATGGESAGYCPVLAGCGRVHIASGVSLKAPLRQLARLSLLCRCPPARPSLSGR